MDEKDLLKFLDQLAKDGDTKESVEKLMHFLDNYDYEPEEELASRGLINMIPFEQVEGKEYEKASRIWADIKNDSKTWSYRPDQYYRPQSLKGVIQAIAAAKEKGLKVRAIGSKHSFSEVIAIGKPDKKTWDVVTKYGNPNRSEAVQKDVKGVYLDLTQTIKAIDDEHAEPVSQAPIDRLKNREHKDKYYNVLNGLKVSMVNHLLCPEREKECNFKEDKNNKHRSLYNTGGGAIQRYAGAFSTGTHGSGGFLSTYHDTVRSIVLVDSDETVHRIEPTNGITDLDKHNAYYNANPNEVPVNLIQDDDKFYAAIVSIGCFGIIYSVIIEVMPMTRLYEQGVYNKGAWTKAEAEIFIDDISDTYGELYDAYEKLENPTLQEIKAIQDKLIFDYFYINPYPVNNNKFSSFIRKTNKYDEREPIGQISHRKIWPTIIAKYKIVADLAKIIFNSGKAPRANLIEKSLGTMNENADNKYKGYIDLSYKVWNQGTGKMAGVGASIEYATPIENLADVLQGVLDILQREAMTKRGYYLDAPIAIRFVKAGNGYLAPNYKEYYPRNKYGKINMNELKTTRVWCYIELITIPGGGKAHKAKQLDLYKFLQDYLTIKGCRPHWGLNFGYPLNKRMLSELYPKFDRWLAAYKTFNKDGRFDNQLTINAGFRDEDVPKA